MAQLNMSLNFRGFGVNMDALNVGDFLGAEIEVASASSLVLQASPSYTMQVSGVNFTYDINEQLISGTITGVVISSDAFTVRFDNVSASATLAGGWILTNATQDALGTFLRGNDFIHATGGQDLVRGYDGNDVIYGDTGADTMFGGTGDDTIYGNAATEDLRDSANYLRGDDGND